MIGRCISLSTEVDEVMMELRRGETQSALVEERRTHFRMPYFDAGSGYPARAAGLETPGRAYGSIIDSRRQFPLYET